MNNKSGVGASIMNVITESLYDKPIVVFREYVQNSVDSFLSAEKKCKDKKFCNHIWTDDNNLYFLDNGTGIKSEDFLFKMQNIALSSKDKTANIGYKGIGRLSGISYCEKLRFINIIDYNQGIFQEYDIDCIKYNKIQKLDDYNEMDFVDLINEIGTLRQNVPVDEICSIIGKNNIIFEQQVTGFLVIMEKITAVLRIIIDESRFEENLCWLLPVPFLDELTSSNEETDELFNAISTTPAFEDSEAIPARSFNIFLNEKPLYRPLKLSMLRTYTCRSNFEKYAVCVHAFSNEKIELDKKNPFSGIRVYIDNMLLCDEGELIPMLQQYGFTKHGVYEIIQAVRGIGAMIYIVDKVNIAANARRTFIELTDQDSINFLELLSSFVDDIYDTRYALSKYASALRNENAIEEDVNKKREKALSQLGKLARENITIALREKETQKEFNELSLTEQKRIVKGKINKEINNSVKEYLDNTNSFDIDTCIDDFKTWFLSN